MNFINVSQTIDDIRPKLKNNNTLYDNKIKNYTMKVRRNITTKFFKYVFPSHIVHFLSLATHCNLVSLTSFVSLSISKEIRKTLISRRKRKTHNKQCYEKRVTWVIPEYKDTHNIQDINPYTRHPKHLSGTTGMDH